MIKANDQSPKHYQAEYQHWDLVLRTGMGYLEGNATKYVSRWRKKDGLKDLEKAAHYVRKLKEEGNAYIRLEVDVSIRPEERAELEREIAAFAYANGLSDQEMDFVAYLVFWRIDGDVLLNPAMSILLALMEQIARAVPAEDSNKHADRFDPYDVNPGGQNQPGGS